MGGPVGKRSDQKHGHRTAAELRVDKAPAGAELVWLDPDPGWHSIAATWYRSLGDSGQSIFYEVSDVATAYYVADVMSRNLSAGKFSAMLFASVISAMGDLLVTEGARRRAKIELQREVAPDTEVDEAIMLLVDQMGGQQKAPTE